MKKVLLATLGGTLVSASVLGFVGTIIIGTNGIIGTTGLTIFLHMVSGLLLVVISMAAPTKMYVCSKLLGALFLFYALLGLIADPDTAFRFLYSNFAGNTFNLVVGLLLFSFAYIHSDTKQHLEPQQMKM